MPQGRWDVFRQFYGPDVYNAYVILPEKDEIWFGTGAGISHFNGTWNSYPFDRILGREPLDNGASGPRHITALASATAGGIWAATDCGELLRWDTFRWQPAVEVGSPITDLLDAGATLWIATNAGLMQSTAARITVVDELAATVIHDLHYAEGYLWVGADNGLWRISPATGDVLQMSTTDALNPLDDVPVTAIWGDGLGGLWLGLGLNLVELDLATGHVQSYSPFFSHKPEHRITAIQGMPNESLWVATNGAGAVQYLFSNGRQVSLRRLGIAEGGGLESPDIRAMALDQDYSIWFASALGIYRYQPWAWHDLDFGGGMPIVDLVFDVHGNLWAATQDAGIQLYHSPYEPPTTLHPPATRAGNVQINDLALDRYGAIWVATEHGVNRYASDKWSNPIADAALPSLQVRTLAPDRHGLWIGTTEGLAYHAFANDSVQWDRNFSGQSIALVSVDQAGRVWVAPQGGGLWRRAPQGAWEDAAQGNELLGRAKVTALSPSPAAAGGMYVAFEGKGIYFWDGATWRVWGQRQFAGSDRIFVISPDRVGDALLVGSMVGLAHIDQYEVPPFDAVGTAPTGSVTAIALDNNGGYWFGGQKGLSWYRPEKSPPWMEITDPTGAGVQKEGDRWRLVLDEQIHFRYSIGDLARQVIATSMSSIGCGTRIARQLAVHQRRTDRRHPGTMGDYALDVVARDAAMNYSALKTFKLVGGLAPSTYMVPLLGVVPVRVLQLLVLFAMLAIVGFGYVSYEFGRERFRVVRAVQRGFNPYISGEPVRSEAMFFGRREMLSRIVSTLHNNCIMIHGERRIGKTTLLYQLLLALRQIDDDAYWFVPVMIDLEGTTSVLFFHLLMDEIVENVGALPQLEPADLAQLSELQVREMAPNDYTDREFGRDLRTVVGLLEEYSASYKTGKYVRLILLLDEVDTLSRFDPLYQQQLRRIFMRDFASTVGAVVAGIAINKEWDRVESPWYNMFNEIEMPPFTRTQAEELLREPVRKFYAFDRAALDFILDQTDGRPYRVQQYAMEAVNHMLARKRRQITMEDAYFAHTELTAIAADAKGELTGSPGNGDRTGTLNHGGIVMKPLQAVK
ncbi:MAG: hypothetical protein IPK16_21915 [Anaerolineales bacterium]|nr:hypothetical protein [Anaerolineales bacterium]